MPTITVKITADDLRDVGSSCTSACVVGRALQRLGLVGNVEPDRIRLYGSTAGLCCEIEIPGQLRRFMRLFDQGLVVSPPMVAIEVPDCWGFPMPN